MPEDTLKRRGFMFVLSSPSGGGKTTLARMLLERDSNLTNSISATTRAKRPGEEHGQHYYFLEKDEFVQMREENKFLEHAKVYGYHYGTPKEPVEQALAAGKDVLFDIDWQGTFQLTQQAREDVVSVFILPPSLNELERRLRARNQDSDEVIRERMRKVGNEINHWYGYDYVMVNYDVEESLGKVAAILRAERLRRTRQQSMGDFVENLFQEWEH